MIKIKFYYQSADKDKTKSMREAISTACYGTNVICQFNNLPDHLILEDILIDKAIAGMGITKFPTCIIYRDEVEYKRYIESVNWETIRNDINYLNGDDLTAQTNRIFVDAYTQLTACNIRENISNIIYWFWKYSNIKVEYNQYIVDNKEDQKIVIRDPWKEYGVIKEIDNLFEDRLKFFINKIPTTLKEAINNKSIVL